VSGEGSTFHVWLPRETVPQLATVHQAAGTRTAS
jgi:hypothetical protein